MPDIGQFHPQIVHFIVALGFVGVGFRVVSLSGRLSWTKPAGATLLLLAAGAGFAAAQSGKDAHGPVERIPGLREHVQEHEELGEKARNIFLLVGLVEIGALALGKKKKIQRGLLAVSAVVGVIGCFALYEAAEHGGHIVYEYAGGTGIHTGDPDDMRHVLVTGLYQQARAAREAGHADEAARLTEELARQAPDDPTIALLAIESTLRDKHDPAGALAALAMLQLPEENPRFQIQTGLLRAEAYGAAGQPDSARAILQALATEFPRSRAVQSALEEGGR